MAAMPRRCPMAQRLFAPSRCDPGHKFGSLSSAGPMLRVLLTNDTRIHAEGLQALRRALAALEDVTVAVIAPDANMSATARSITTRRPLWVTEVPFEDGPHGFSCDGTPVDCVRLASLGLVDEFEPDLVVAGINHGSNL